MSKMIGVGLLTFEQRCEGAEKGAMWASEREVFQTEGTAGVKAPRRIMPDIFGS